MNIIIHRDAGSIFVKESRDAEKKAEHALQKASLLDSASQLYKKASNYFLDGEGDIGNQMMQRAAEMEKRAK